MPWRIEQAQAFQEQVEHSTDAERVILADAYRRCCATGQCPIRPPPAGGSPVPRSTRRDADALVLPTVVVGDQVLGDTIVVQAAHIIRSP